MKEFLFGNLTLAALPHQWFTIGGTISMMLGGLLTIVLLTYFKKWRWLWGWVTSTDPKKIGIMYIVVASLMFFRGGLDVGLIWLQQATSVGASHGILSADHLQQVFTAHGDIMVFFVTMGFLFGLINIIVPLQIGARDLAFPFLNTLGFWLYVAGAILINLFFVLGGDFAATGWLAIAPLSELQYSPGVGVDYWMWSLQISGLGTLLGGINFIVTILKMRAPGMTLMKMPLFTWTSLCSMFLVVSIFPILTVTMGLLFLDRYFGMHFFTTSFGGNAMMYTNLIWMWGHPEVYVLILPAFGVYSEIVSTFTRKKLFSYTSVVISAIAVTVLALSVWLHHFFTMGAGADVNAFFGIMTMLIAIPTGAQVLNWLSTMYKAKIRFSTPMLWFLGFIVTFTLGGVAGVMMAVPPIDFQVHNSLFLVAHFHTMIIGGALFGIFAGFTYWFPKVTGFKLNERLGRYAFWLWLIGFFVSFIPLYILGFLGATRRLDHYAASTGWQPFFIIAAVGLGIIILGALMQLTQIAVSFFQRKQNLDTTGDPWDGRTLEWATSSPPQHYNFAIIPKVSERDAFWEMKQKGLSKPTNYEDIVMPKNTPLGIYVAVFCFLIGFALVWHINWLAVVGIVGALFCVIWRTFDENTEEIIPASEVARLEAEREQNG
ncbi:MAG TPA: cbb3-type cytochrome c oxidase subunit I [Candidatus Saccharimonadales bacterium]|nr:cbb3-type cytochrome c oxidase subunit I [Candidatus Saccharimonadales bacterium]